MTPVIMRYSKKVLEKPNSVCGPDKLCSINDPMTKAKIGSIKLRVEDLMI